MKIDNEQVVNVAVAVAEAGGLTPGVWQRAGRDLGAGRWANVVADRLFRGDSLEEALTQAGVSAGCVAATLAIVSGEEVPFPPAHPRQVPLAVRSALVVWLLGVAVVVGVAVTAPVAVAVWLLCAGLSVGAAGCWYRYTVAVAEEKELRWEVTVTAVARRAGFDVTEPSTVQSPQKLMPVLAGGCAAGGILVPLLVLAVG